MLDETELPCFAGNCAVIVYKNHRGEVATRRIYPGCIRHGSNEWHPKPQWLMDALDLEKNEMRTFAMADIIEWKR